MMRNYKIRQNQRFLNKRNVLENILFCENDRQTMREQLEFMQQSHDRTNSKFDQETFQLGLLCNHLSLLQQISYTLVFKSRHFLECFDLLFIDNVFNILRFGQIRFRCLLF